MKVELVGWADVRENTMDTNNGYVFGLNYLDENGEVVEVEWFTTNGERENTILKESLVVQN